MISPLDAALDRLHPISLTELNEQAAMLHRRDRKYLVDRKMLAGLLAAVPEGVRVLETEAGRWSHYESVYLDTPDFDLYHLAARKRPNRCKVRVRHYLDSGLGVAEVKTKGRNRTHKYRRRSDALAPRSLDAAHTLAREHVESARFAESLMPTLTTAYRRATLALPAGWGRVTIDLEYRAFDELGRSTDVGDLAIVETKTGGAASPFDRALWSAGCRPVKFSKYCTAMAVLHPGLPANRWHRVLRHHRPHPLTPTPSLHRQGAPR